MLGASRSHYRSVAWEGMNIVDAHAALGYMDYGLLSAVQIDKFGNFNSTFLGSDYEQPGAALRRARRRQRDRLPLLAHDDHDQAGEA